MDIQLTEEQQKVYTSIVNSKKSGITKANLVKNSGMNAKEVDKIIKILENRNRIKSVRPNGKTTGAKLWIDFNQTLESSLPQNAFRTTDTGVDEELVQKLQQKIIYYLQSQAEQKADLGELRRVYKSVQSEAFDEQDFERIINLLKFDSTIIDDGNQYLKLNPFNMSQFTYYLSYLPCQTCPVYKNCRVGNTISPENCPFQW